MQRYNTKEKTVEMSVKFRFKSSIEFTELFFTGNYISVGDLRKEITKQMRLAANADYELQIMNAETKHVYEFDPTLIPANTKLIVSRIPVEAKTSNTTQVENTSATPIENLSPVENNMYNSQQTNNYENVGNSYNNYYGGEYGSNGGYYDPSGNYYDPNMGYDSYYYNQYNEPSGGYSYQNYEYNATTETPNAEGTQEPNPNLQYVPMTNNASHRYKPYVYSRRCSKDDYAVTLTGQTQNSEIESEVKGISAEGEGEASSSPEKCQDLRGSKSRMHGKVPDNYRCFKCQNKGHWIKHCPLLKDGGQMKRSTGIPRSQMVIISDPVEGAYVTPEGRYAVPVTHLEAVQRAERQSH